MRIVIDIPNELKWALDKNEEYRLYTESVGHVMLTAIKNGTVLPEHYGRLGDIDKLKAVFNKNVVGANAFDDLFDAAEAIVPATKSEV